MILVTGATGQLGRRIIDQLVARRGGTAGIAASVRDPARAGETRPNAASTSVTATLINPIRCLPRSGASTN
jgi:uncharacterized protein YbjT (DUF2867 family)